MTMLTLTPMRMVSGLIEFSYDVLEENMVPAGKYYTMAEYAKKFKLNYATVRKHVSLGKIESYYVDHKRVIPSYAKPPKRR